MVESEIFVHGVSLFMVFQGFMVKLLKFKITLIINRLAHNLLFYSTKELNQYVLTICILSLSSKYVLE